tara:strand:+ start:1095 stop:1355 length:261 start_codon:yes stop_codon:yes gene_type:complete
MNKFKNKNGYGSLFVNNYKEKETQPDYKGNIVLQDGTEKEIAGWKKQDKNGKYFLSLHLSDVYIKKVDNESKVNNETKKESSDLPF